MTKEQTVPATLAELSCGATARVAAVKAGPDDRDGLYDLGLVPGAEVRCLRAAPLGDPVAYLLAGSVVALRRRDARQVQIEIAAPAEESPV